MKRIMILGVAAIPFFFASCGGNSVEGEESTGADTTVVVEEDVVTVMDYAIDTATSVINWNNYSAGDIDHQGTIGLLSGSAQLTNTNGTVEITGGSLMVDMNSISEGSEKLEGHLMAPDFFDVNTFATTEFMFDRHEDGMVYGKAMIIGKEVAIEAPVEVSEMDGSMTLEVGEFKIDFGQLEMPFFVAEVDAPEEEKHDPVIGFSGTINGVTAQ